MAEQSLAYRPTGGFGSDDEAVPDIDPSDVKNDLFFSIFQPHSQPLPLPTPKEIFRKGFFGGGEGERLD